MEQASLWSRVVRRAGQLSPAQLLVGGYLVLISAGAALLSLPLAVASPPRLSLLQALFTAASAACVTGLTVVDTGSRLSGFGQGVVLLLIQIGGLGITTISTLVAVLLGRRISLRGRMFVQEELHGDYLSGLVRLVRLVAMVTLLFELAGTLVLSLAWSATLPPARAAYFGLFHAVSAYNNAGFDLWGTSLEAFAGRPAVVLTVAGLFIAGGIGFSVLADLLSWRRGHRLQLHSRVALVMAGLLVVAGWAAVLLLEWGNPRTLGPMPAGQKLLDGFFTAVTPRTAGFSVVSTGGLQEATLLMLMVLMFIGVSPGSAGGGVKTTTAAVVGLTVRAALSGQEDLIVFQRRLPREVVPRAIAVVVLAAAWVGVVGLVVMALEPFEPMASLFEVVSAFGTVGLSTGITADLSPLSQVLLVLTMLAGKVGPLTLYLTLARRSRAAGHWRFPEERINLG